MANIKNLEKELNNTVNDLHNTLLTDTYKQLIGQLNNLNDDIMQKQSKKTCKKPISIIDIYSVLNLHPYPKCPICGEELEFDEFNYLNAENKYRITCTCCDYSITDQSWELVVARFNNDALSKCKSQYRSSGGRYILACLGLNLIFGWVSFPMLLGTYGVFKFMVGPKVVEYFFDQRIKEFKKKYPYKTTIEKMNIKEIQCNSEHPNYKEFITVTNDIYNIISDFPTDAIVNNFIAILVESNKIVDFIDTHPKNQSQISHFLNHAHSVRKIAKIYKNVLQYSAQDKKLIQQIEGSTKKLLLVYQELYKQLINNAFEEDRATLKVINQLADEVLKRY